MTMKILLWVDDARNPMEEIVKLYGPNLIKKQLIFLKKNGLTLFAWIMI